jgi:hypothetical protein
MHKMHTARLLTSYSRIAPPLRYICGSTPVEHAHGHGDAFPRRCDRIVDARAVQLALNPWQFDVLLCTDLFGDILLIPFTGDTRCSNS